MTIEVDETQTAHAVRPHLSFWDGVSIIIGIVVGVSIFKTSLIFSSVTGPWQMVGVWVFGGVLTLLGAFCYAELATTYPQAGGDYAYLKQAFGDKVAYLFGWAQVSVVLTGSIGAMAYVFADYASKLFGASIGKATWAAGSVLALAVANILGAHVGKTVQNLLTVVKIVGLSAIVVAGFWAGGEQSLVSVEGISSPSFGLAMILVLYAYGGWNDAAYVAAEVTDRNRNMPRVLIVGSVAILLVYVLINLSYLWGLGYDGVVQSAVPAADLASMAWGPSGAKVISLLVMVSALGAVNGLLFTGSRISTSLGADHVVFARLNRWDPRLRTPVWAIGSSALISLAMIGLVGTERGRDNFDAVLSFVHLGPMPWERFFGGFETLVAGTSPVFWVFFLLTGISLFVLRWKNPDRPRPFSVPLFPWTPLVFCLTSVYMLQASLTYAGPVMLIGIVPLVAGVPLYWVGRKPKA